MNTLMRCAAVALVMIGSARSFGQLLDNTDQPQSAVTIMSTSGMDQLWSAQSFAIPGCASLMSIEVFLGELVGEATPIAQLRVGTPDGPVLASFVVPPLTTGPVELVTLSLESDVSLVRNLYWLVIGPADVGSPEVQSFGWAYALGNVSTGPASFQNYAYSSDFGATWCCANSDNPYLIKLNGILIGCAGDFNCIDGVTVQDIFDYLSDWNAQITGGTPIIASADFNYADGVTVQDIFDFLQAWSEGCP